MPADCTYNFFDQIRLTMRIVPGNYATIERFWAKQEDYAIVTKVKKKGAVETKNKVMGVTMFIA